MQCSDRPFKSLDFTIREGLVLVAYEFCARDGLRGSHLVGILPERRKDPTVVTDESVMNWVSELTRNNIKRLYFTRVTLRDG